MDILYKKMKRASVSFDRPHDTDDEAKTKLKYQTLLKEYLEVQKEYVSRKRKLQATTKKRERILAEVRFLRRKRNYLLKIQAPNINKVPLHLPKSYIESNTLQEARDQCTYEVTATKFDQVLVSNLHLKNEEEEGDVQVHGKNVRYTKNLKKYSVQGKGVGKQKICWPDQVTLNV